MRKLLLTFAFVLPVTCALCQHISYGAFVGLNQTSVPMIYNGKPFANSTQGGYSIGGVANIKLGKFLSFQPGLYFTRKGGTTLHDTIYVNIGVPKNPGRDKLELYYGEIPINFIFHVQVEGATIFTGGGPYVAAKLSSMVLFKIDNDNEGYNETPYGPLPLKSTDLGYNVLVGIRFAKGFTVRIAYEKSLGTIYDGQSNVKNQGFNYSVGYFFK